MEYALRFVRVERCSVVQGSGSGGMHPGPDIQEHRANLVVVASAEDIHTPAVVAAGRIHRDMLEGMGTPVVAEHIRRRVAAGMSAAVG